MPRHHWVYFSAVLLPILLFVCVSTSLGQENQQESHRQARAWLEFNHHVGGVIVLVLAALTWLEVLENSAAKAIRLAWPICLIVIGFYNVILSDRFAGPVKPSTLVENLSDPEVLSIRSWPSWFWRLALLSCSAGCSW
jgi:cytochrome bd-type quinol oxidase subunit 2